MGGMAIVMERRRRHYLQLDGYRVTQPAQPTMFSRLLKLPNDVRRKYDLLAEIAIHAAAPRPVRRRSR